MWDSEQTPSGWLTIIVPVRLQLISSADVRFAARENTMHSMNVKRE